MLAVQGEGEAGLIFSAHHAMSSACAPPDEDDRRLVSMNQNPIRDLERTHKAIVVLVDFIKIILPENVVYNGGFSMQWLKKRLNIGEKNVNFPSEKVNVPQNAPSNEDSEQAIRILTELCTRNDVFLDQMKEMLADAQNKLRSAGDEGSRALARLIGDLEQSRSGKIGWALRAAEASTPTTELVSAVQKITIAEPIKPGGRGRFAPEILGQGAIGWTDSSFEYIRAAAVSALSTLTGNEIESPAD